MQVTMPVKEYIYLKDHFDRLDSYVINITYAKENVTLDFLRAKIEQFKIDYHALVVRIGLDGEETYNDTWNHLNAIYDNYFLNDFGD